MFYLSSSRNSSYSSSTDWVVMEIGNISHFELHNTCALFVFYNLAFPNNTMYYLTTDNQGSERRISFPKATYNKQ